MPPRETLSITIVGIRVAAVGAIIAGITWIGYSLIPVNATTAGFAYLVAILFVAAHWGLIESIAGSVGAVLAFNYYFLPPIGRFTIADPQNWVALFAFLVTAVTASHFSRQARLRALEATNRQKEMETLYAFSRSILLIQPSQNVAKQLAMQIAQTFGASSVALYEKDSGQIHHSGPEDFPGASERLQKAAIEGTFFRDAALRTVVTSVRLGAQPIGGLGLRDVDLSDSALQGLANLVAIGLERSRAQASASRAEAARQSDELKSTLLDALAHEFKTPLTSIKAASTALLASDGIDSAQRHELLSVVDEEADRLSILVTEAIQMARIEAGRVHLRREDNSVAAIVAAAAERFNTQAEGRTISVRIPSAIPTIWVDRELMEVALRQLIDNALKYSPVDSPVRVEAEQDSARVIVSVADRGPGIAESEQPRIFEKFYRADSSRHQVPGAGLGLVIAREIIHMHGGEIWVESKPGEGSVFRFSVPTAAPEQRGAGAPIIIENHADVHETPHA
jgi:two-component system, OmpR family, sensor histidine kinase KdpD